MQSLKYFFYFSRPISYLPIWIFWGLNQKYIWKWIKYILYSIDTTGRIKTRPVWHVTVLLTISNQAQFVGNLYTQIFWWQSLWNTHLQGVLIHVVVHILVPIPTFKVIIATSKYSLNWMKDKFNSTLPACIEWKTSSINHRTYINIEIWTICLNCTICLRKYQLKFEPAWWAGPVAS